MLHIAHENLEKFSAGNIYLFQENDISDWIPNKDVLLDDLIDLTDEQKKNEMKDDLSVHCKQILMEISPVCDHAQMNVRIARFVVGLLIPMKNKINHKKLKNRDSFYRFGPLFLEGNTESNVEDGLYHIYFNARYVVTHDLEKARSFKAFVCLRSQAFADLQAWLARQASRPGLLLLR